MKLNLKTTSCYICYNLDLPKNSSDNIISTFDEDTYIKIFNTTSQCKTQSLQYITNYLYPHNQSIIKYFEMPCEKTDQSLFSIIQLSHSYKRAFGKKLVLVSNLFYKQNEIITKMNLEPYHHEFIKGFHKKIDLDEIINCYKVLKYD